MLILGPHRVELCVLVYKTSPQNRRGRDPKMWLFITTPAWILIRRNHLTSISIILVLFLNTLTFTNKYMFVSSNIC